MATQTLTVVFTDIERSTELWEQYPSAMHDVVTEHFRALEAAAERHGGRLVRKSGDGGMLAFESSVDAVEATVWIQTQCAAAARAGIPQLRLRIGVNTGECHVHDDDLFGGAVNLAARLESAAHGNQVLVGEATAGLIADSMPDGIELINLGEVTFKGLGRAVQVHQVHAPGLRRAFPALRLLDTGRLHVPAESGPLFGRAQDLAEAHARLADSRMVTLVGGPGIGKTRMAQRLAHEIRRPYDDGVRFCSLRSASGQSVEQLLAASLGLSDLARDELEHAIIGSLEPYRTLVVLDNCEVAIGRVRRLARLLLDHCPDVGILATSREPLLLAGERPVVVAPLPLPSATDDRGTFLATPSVQLFLDCALSADPSIDVTTIDQDLVARVLRRTDGVPLAIELEAPALATIPLADLAARSAVVAATRSHEAAIRSAIDASYVALEAVERQTFEHVATFEQAFDADAATELLDLPKPTVLDALAGLSHRSLLQRETVGGGTDRRFRMLRPVRDFAMEQASEAELAGRRRRHADVFSGRLAGDCSLLLTDRQAAAVDRLERDLGDHRAAIRHLIDCGRLEQAEAAVINIERFCHGRGYRDPYRWAAELVELGADTRGRATEIYGIHALGAWLDGDMEKAIAIAMQGRALEDSPKPGTRILVEMALVNSFGYLGQLERVASHFGALIRDCRASGSPYWSCYASGLEAVAMMLTGRPGDAETKARQAIDEAVRLGNPDCVSWALFSYGTSVADDDLDRAISALERSCSSARSVGAGWHVLLSLDQLARFQLKRGSLIDAAATLVEALEIITSIGNGSQLGQIYRLAADVLAAAGRPGPFLLAERAVARPAMPKTGITSDDGRLGLDGAAALDAMLLDDSRILSYAREALTDFLASDHPRLDDGGDP